MRRLILLSLLCLVACERAPAHWTDQCVETKTDWMILPVPMTTIGPNNTIQITLIPQLTPIIRCVRSERICILGPKNQPCDPEDQH